MATVYNPKIERIEIDDTHFYFVDGVFAAGASTIISEALPNTFARYRGDVGNDFADRKLEMAGIRGSAIHALLESLLRGDEVDFNLPSNDKELITKGFGAWLNEYKPKVLRINGKQGIEFTVASRLGYAGTLDLFCEINGEPYIVDFKTSSSISAAHKLQILAYKQAIIEMTGITPKVGILHLKASTQKKYQFIDEMKVGNRELTVNDFTNVFNTWLNVIHGGRMPEPPEIITFPDKLKLTDLYL